MQIRNTLFCIIALTAAFGAHAETPAHDHGHDAHGAQLMTLNHGQKWSTDAPLRQSMQQIRALVEQNQHNQSTDYPALAHGIHSNIEYMVQNCKLEPQADATLHVIIGDMFNGIELLEGKQGEAARHHGVEQIAAALHKYTEYFDHPGFAQH